MNEEAFTRLIGLLAKKTQMLTSLIWEIIGYYLYILHTHRQSCIAIYTQNTCCKKRLLCTV